MTIAAVPVGAGFGQAIADARNLRYKVAKKCGEFGPARGLGADFEQFLQHVRMQRKAARDLVSKRGAVSIVQRRGFLAMDGRVAAGV